MRVAKPRINPRIAALSPGDRHSVPVTQYIYNSLLGVHISKEQADFLKKHIDDNTTILLERREPRP